MLDQRTLENWMLNIWDRHSHQCIPVGQWLGDKYAMKKSFSIKYIAF